MAKISRPVIYAVVAAVAIYAIVLVTEPEPPAKKTTKRTNLGAGIKAPTGFLPEDLTARFAPYAGKSRDAFKPEIVSKQAIINALPGGKSGGVSAAGLRGSWTLTGINVVNGSRSALIENADDTVFLKTGDAWNGLQVVEIGSDTVVFLNSLGQRSQLKFVDPNDEAAKTPGTTTVTVPGSAPSRTTITVTPINKNGLTITPGGVAPVIPTIPATPPGGVGNGNPVLPRRQR